MTFLVKVQVKLDTLRQFGAKLQAGELDRSCIKSDTWCLKDKPEVGFSVWEAADRKDFEKHFSQWRQYYDQTEVSEVTTPAEAMGALLRRT